MEDFSMWNGVFSPNLRKHRDYEHDSFFAHLLDNGGSYSIDPQRVKVKYRPLNARLHQPSDVYYFVDIDFGGHDDESNVYEFLIHSEPDFSVPNERRIANEFDAIVADPLIGPRDWFDYLDFDADETLTHPRVRARLDDGEPPRMGPPRQRRHGDDEVESWVDSL